MAAKLITSNTGSAIDTNPVNNNEYKAWGEALTIPAEGPDYWLSSFMVSLRRYGSFSGDVWAEVYATTGTVGSDAYPKGSPLAVSASFDSTSISTSSFQWVTLEFDETFKLEAGASYVLVVTSDTGTSSDYVSIRLTAETDHPGNAAVLYGSSWTSSSIDCQFQLYGTPDEEATTYDETGKNQIGLINVSVTDTQVYSETGLSQIILAITDSIQAQTYNDLGLEQVILTVTTRTDSQNYAELQKAETILAVLSRADSLKCGEAGKTQVALIVQARSDGMIYSDLAKAQVIMANQTETENVNYSDLGKSLIVTVISGKSDLSIYKETAKSQIILAVTGETDEHISIFDTYNEIGLTQIISAVTGRTDKQTYAELNHTQEILSITGKTESLVYAPENLGEVALITTAKTDIHVNNELAHNQIVIAISGETDEFTSVYDVFDELGLTQTIIVNNSIIATQNHAETQKSQIINAVISKTESISYSETGKNQVILVTQAKADTMVYRDTSKSQVITTVLTKADNQSYFSNTGQLILSTQSRRDNQIYNEIGKNQILLATQLITDSFYVGFEEFNELGLSQIINAVIGEKDNLRHGETLNQVILSVTGKSESLILPETSHAQIITAVTAKTEYFTYGETGLSQVIIANVVETDVYICSQDLGLTQVALLIPTEQDNQSCVEYARNQTIEIYSDIVDILINDETGLEQIIKVVLEKVAGFAFDETGEIVIKVKTTFNLDAFEKVAHLEGELANIILEGELADIVLEGEITIITLEGDT